MSEQSNLFEVDDNGVVTYTSPEPVFPEPDNLEEGDITDAGSNFVEGDDIGNILQSPETVPEDNPEDSTQAPEVVIPVTDDGLVPVLLSEEVTAAILADTPASGSIGSSTIDYFDRIVSGLPQDYKYVAYRTDSDDSYDAILYYGRHFDIEDNVITFGRDAREVIVDRSSTSGYNNITNYYTADASHVSVEFEQDGAVVYYTNAAPGYPVLGGFSQSLSYTPFVLSALICAFVTVVFNKLLKG